MFARTRQAITTPAGLRVQAVAQRHRKARSSEGPRGATAPSNATAGWLGVDTAPPESPRGRHARRRPVMFAVALALCALGGAVGPSLAQAGTWTLVSCTQPDGQVAPIDGWTSVAFDGGGNYSSASNSCGAPGGGLFATSSSAWPQTRGSGWMWQFDAPAGATITGGNLDVMLTSPVGQAFVLTPNFTYDGADVVVNCQFNVPCGSNGVFSGTVPIDHVGGTSLYAGVMCLGPGQPGQADADCAAGDGVNGVNVQLAIYAAQIELTDNAAPTASAFSGPLLAPDARGGADVLFTAGDPNGPGVYQVSATVDGTTAYQSTPDTNGGECASVGDDANGDPEFLDEQPCKQSESVDLPVDTTAFTDGTHTLKITVTDAAQNSSVVYDGTISTKNAPTDTGVPTTSGHDVDVFVGDGLAGKSGSWSAPSGAGWIGYSYQWEDCDGQGNSCAAIAGATASTYTAAPSDVGDTLRVQVTAADNDGFASAMSAPSTVVQSASGSSGAGPGPGTTPPSSGGTPAPTPSGNSSGPSGGPGTPNGSVASVSAVLRLGLRRVISRSFARRAFTLQGRLLGPTGAPVTGATLEVLQQVLGGASGPMRLIAHAKTGKGGAFTVNVPAGPSRLVEVAYRANSDDTTYATVARMEEQVSAGVTLTVAPTATSSNGSIALTGRVEGAVPHQGVVVELLVHYLGHWEPFRSVRTSKTGRFRVRYQFQGGRGRFPFRARVRGDQLSFPFTLGQSKVHDVDTH